MLSINLISRETKQEIKLKYVLKFVRRSCGWLIVLTVTCAIILFLGKMALQDHFTETVNRTSLVSKKGESYDAEVKAINSQLNSIIKIQEGFASYSAVLEDLMEYIDGNITMTTIQLNAANTSIELRGLANTRDNLIAFKDRLESSGVFTDINLPLESILQKENINFQIIAKIDIQKTIK